MLNEAKKRSPAGKGGRGADFLQLSRVYQEVENGLKMEIRKKRLVPVRKERN